MEKLLVECKLKLERVGFDIMLNDKELLVDTDADETLNIYNIISKRLAVLRYCFMVEHIFTNKIEKHIRINSIDDESLKKLFKSEDIYNIFIKELKGRKINKIKDGRHFVNNLSFGMKIKLVNNLKSNVSALMFDDIINEKNIKFMSLNAWISFAENIKEIRNYFAHSSCIGINFSSKLLRIKNLNEVMRKLPDYNDINILPIDEYLYVLGRLKKKKLLIFSAKSFKKIFTNI